MFDYSEEKDVVTYPKIIIKTSGMLYRNKSSYQLVFKDNGSK